MRIVKSFGAVGLGLAVAFVGFSSNNMHSAPMGAIQSGSGKMTVLYNGVEGGPIDFGDSPLSPGEPRNVTVEVKNEGQIDFVSSVSSGEYPDASSMVYEMATTVTDESGAVVYEGLYPKLTVTGLDVPVGESEKLTVTVRWMPPEDADLSQSRNGNFALNVIANQKI